MRLGVALPNTVPDVRADTLPRWATAVEEAGFASVGTVGRIAFPGVMDLIALAAAAAVTTRVELLSHVLLAPVWPPVLLAKQAAGIDGISGGRLTLGLGVGYRDDDFVSEGHGFAGRGARFDADLAVYHQVWGGELVAGMRRPAVPSGTRRIPLLFGGLAPKAIARAARWGDGLIAAIPSPAAAAASFDQARSAWRAAGRPAAPRLVAITYFGLTDPDAARTRIDRYYSNLGENANYMTKDILTSPPAVRDAVAQYADIGADDLMFIPGTDNLDDIHKLADCLL
jgi:alkanesulfonate monooxygenase SsuD/methylene tetrahydromethanopterin reductase-like flavin-dependent oxidoreductase (luciferase family)